jgi:hypothetical protein
MTLRGLASAPGRLIGDESRGESGSENVMMRPEHGGCMSATTDAKTERRLLKRPRSSFEGRWDYTAIGTVTNLAARLCGEARSDQILISQSLLPRRWTSSRPSKPWDR